MVADIRNAPEAAAEADAINRLRAWASEHRMTYTVTTRRVGSDQVVTGPSVATFPVRSEVILYRGPSEFHRFEFVPRSNSNLALLGGGQ